MRPSKASEGWDPVGSWAEAMLGAPCWCRQDGACARVGVNVLGMLQSPVAPEHQGRAEGQGGQGLTLLDVHLRLNIAGNYDNGWEIQT